VARPKHQRAEPARVDQAELEKEREREREKTRRGI
jgi:hypothetical protein